MICIHTQRCTVRIYQSHPYLIDKNRGTCFTPTTGTHHPSPSMPSGAHLEVTISMEGRTISPSGTKPWGPGIHPLAISQSCWNKCGPQSFFPKSMGFLSVFSWKKWVYSISNRIVTTPFSTMILGEGVKKNSLFGTPDWRKGVSFSLKLHSLKRQKPACPLKLPEKESANQTPQRKGWFSSNPHFSVGFRSPASFSGGSEPLARKLFRQWTWVINPISYWVRLPISRDFTTSLCSLKTNGSPLKMRVGKLLSF